jgi:peptidoglycan lytic transglycosylase
MPFAIGRYLALCVLLGMLSACAHQARGPSPALPTDPISPDSDEMEGIASWYGRPHHGRRVASGEIYNMHRLTAAHRTLPFDTIVLVQNKRNGREVTVRINDRGPFVKGRVIDLSYAAAKALDMLVPGTAPVTLKVVRSNAQYPEQEFAIQVAACNSQWPVEERDICLDSESNCGYCMAPSHDVDDAVSGRSARHAGHLTMCQETSFPMLYGFPIRPASSIVPVARLVVRVLLVDADAP